MGLPFSMFTWMLEMVFVALLIPEFEFPLNISLLSINICIALVVLKLSFFFIWLQIDFGSLCIFAKRWTMIQEISNRQKRSEFPSLIMTLAYLYAFKEIHAEIPPFIFKIEAFTTNTSLFQGPMVFWRIKNFLSLPLCRNNLNFPYPDEVGKCLLCK